MRSRPRPVEGPGVETRDLLGELLVGTRSGQTDLAQVVADVEVDVVDPDRLVDAERDRHEPLPEDRHRADA